VEESHVERIEDLVEIVAVAGVTGESLAAAGLSDVLCLFGDSFRGDMPSIAVGVGTSNGLLVQLGEQDVGDGMMN
jgi:hypothetical protein